MVNEALRKIDQTRSRVPSLIPPAGLESRPLALKDEDARGPLYDELVVSAKLNNLR